MYRYYMVCWWSLVWSCETRVGQVKIAWFFNLVIKMLDNLWSSLCSNSNLKNPDLFLYEKILNRDQDFINFMLALARAFSINVDREFLLADSLYMNLLIFAPLPLSFWNPFLFLYWGILSILLSLSHFCC